MAISDVRKDEKVLQWFSLSEMAESTRASYASFMQIYCECVKKSPTVLINEALTEIKKGKLPAERKTVGYFAKYKECLQQRGYAPKSFGYAISVVNSFYSQFDVDLSKMIGRNKKRPRLEENDVLLSKQDVTKLIDYAASVRDRAIILLMATSGLARREVLNIRFKDYEFDNEAKIGVITIRRQKTSVDYITFCSPEACEAIEIYLQERRRDPELKKHMEADDVIFVTYNTNNQGGYRGGKISSRSFTKIFGALAEKLDYKNGDGWVKCSSHHLRTYCATTLENDGMPRAKVHVLLGHKSNDIDSAYFKDKSSESFKKLKQLYIDHVKALSFRVTPIINSFSPEANLALETLKDENENLKDQNLDRDQKILEAEDKIKAFEKMLDEQQRKYNDLDRLHRENEKLRAEALETQQKHFEERQNEIEKQLKELRKYTQGLQQILYARDSKRYGMAGSEIIVPEMELQKKMKKGSEK